MFIGSLWDHMGSFQQIGWPLNWANLQKIWRQASGYRRMSLDVSAYLKDIKAQVESWKEFNWFHHLMKFPWRVKVSCFSGIFGPKMRTPIATDVFLGMFPASITCTSFHMIHGDWRLIFHDLPLAGTMEPSHRHFSRCLRWGNVKNRWPKFATSDFIQNRVTYVWLLYTCVIYRIHIFDEWSLVDTPI